MHTNVTPIIANTHTIITPNITRETIYTYNKQLLLNFLIYYILLYRNILKTFLY